jgi:hypothetical protein
MDWTPASRTTATAPWLRRAAQKLRDGEYSHGAAALDLARRAGTSLANFAILLGLQLYP